MGCGKLFDAVNVAGVRSSKRFARHCDDHGSEHEEVRGW